MSITLYLYVYTWDWTFFLRVFVLNRTKSTIKKSITLLFSNFLKVILPYLLFTVFYLIFSLRWNLYLSKYMKLALLWMDVRLRGRLDSVIEIDFRHDYRHWYQKKKEDTFICYKKYVPPIISGPNSKIQLLTFSNKHIFFWINKEKKKRQVVEQPFETNFLGGNFFENSNKHVWMHGAWEHIYYGTWP